jgi:hypothetical protein
MPLVGIVDREHVDALINSPNVRKLEKRVRYFLVSRILPRLDVVKKQQRTTSRGGSNCLRGHPDSLYAMSDGK